MSFAPVNQVHQCLHAFHFPSNDRTRAIPAFHYCSHREGFFQCILYDSNEPDARLIGVEYLITEAMFKTLPPDEKKYWHSHKHEVGSGLLVVLDMAGVKGTVAQAASTVPGVEGNQGGGINNHLEAPAMHEIYRMYGKAIHLWDFERDALPLGPPMLVMSTTEDGQVPMSAMKARDKRLGVDTEAKRKYRSTYLDPNFEPDESVDLWWKTGRAPVFVVEEREVKGLQKGDK